ncbi:DUF4012 domain-containing protein [Microbacterium sp. 11MF]|uniref:DUF4012 domain-containing protein n=1 Tax=Microbacterium sp. 11MF TaxID=1169146 RepID=UPI00035E6196|nr:DUF4012 domain-containing protein [Microbacterium sp. 11MF]
MPETFLPPAARTAGRVVVWVLGLALLLLVFAIGWLGVRGYLAYWHLSAAQQKAPAIAKDIDNLSAAQAALDDLAEDTSNARSLTSDPIWQGAEGVPWIGPQLAAVADVAEAVDEVVNGTARPIASVAGGFGVTAFVPVDGRIDTAVFSALADPAAKAAKVAASARDDVASIDRTPLVTPIADAVDKLGGLLSEVASGTDALARASALLPSMLGADGPRTHLLLVQNNSEWRTLGGIVGSMTPIVAKDGALALGEQIQARGIPSYPDSVLDLGDYRTIYNAKPGRFLQNITQVPDFRLTSQLATEFAKRNGVTADGVMSIDPVALSYLLKATGPVTLPTGDVLTSENAAGFLLNEVYIRYPDADQQDLVFSAAAGAVFTALTKGDVNPGALITALGRAGSEHRLYLWSAKKADETVLAGTTLAGEPVQSTADTARMGVYFNDGTGSKMDYYVTPDVQLSWSGCGTGSTPRTLSLQVTLTNTVPADAATSLPEYITGAGSYGVPEGIARVVGEVYLPAGFAIGPSTTSTGAGFGGAMIDGRQVLSYTFDLKPGETESVSIDVVADTDIREAEAWVTPTADASRSPIVDASCDPTGSDLSLR